MLPPTSHLWPFGPTHSVISLSLGCVWSYWTAAPGEVIQTLWMGTPEICLLLCLAIFLSISTLCSLSCVHSSKPGLKIPLDCLAKQSTVLPGEFVQWWSLHQTGFMFVIFLSRVQVSHRYCPVLTHTASYSAKCLTEAVQLLYHLHL